MHSCTDSCLGRTQLPVEGVRGNRGKEGRKGGRKEGRMEGRKGADYCSDIWTIISVIEMTSVQLRLAVRACTHHSTAVRRSTIRTVFLAKGCGWWGVVGVSFVENFYVLQVENVFCK